MKNILLVEDDPAIVEGISIALENEHYNVAAADSSKKSYAIIERGNIDLIILDIVLGQDSGIEICRRLRSEKINIPIIMLTAKKDEIDKVLGLEIGADDYMTKPFSIKELIARIHVIFRRQNMQSNDVVEYSFENIRLNFKKLEAVKADKKIDLSTLEFKILKYFIEHKGEVLNRDNLLDKVWGYDAFPTTRTVDNYILSIRKKIEDDPSEPKHLITIHKAGYKFI